MYPRSRRDVWLVSACLLTSAVWIALGPIHRHHTADSIVMALVSLYRWTPLYWEQDRLGMFFPLVATPWHEPLDNLLVQAALTTLAGLASFFLLGVYVLGRSRGLVAGALAAIFLVGFCKLDQQFEHLVMLQQNAQALALGVGGLLLMEKWGRSRRAGWLAAGMLCLLVTHWINPAAAFVLGPLVIVRGLLFRDLGAWTEQDDLRRSDVIVEVECGPIGTPRSWRERLLPGRAEVASLTVIALSVVASMVLSRSVAQPLPYRLLSPAESWDCGRVMYRHLHVYFHHRWFSATEIAAGLALFTLALPAGRVAARRSLPMVAGLLAVAAALFVFMSSLEHVAQNHSARYVIPSVLVWQMALVGFAVVQFGVVLPVTRWSRALPTGLAVAMTLVVMLTHGRPGLDVVRRELDSTLGRYTDDILAADCTHVTGDYWHVWPAVFHANLRLAESGTPRTIWGIAPRSRATETLWRDVPWQTVRIAEITGDERQAAEVLARYRVPPRVDQCPYGAIRVLTLTADWDSAAAVAAGRDDRK